MCSNCKNPDAKLKKNGFYIKKKKRKVQRYKCLSCGHSSSDQTGSNSYRLQKTHVRNRLFQLLCSGTSQRRAANLLGIDKDTVARLIQKMALTAAEKNRLFSEKCSPKTVVFDEMETFEHSKCKPVSITVAVEEDTRFILSLEAAQMPAKGLLAAVSRKRYGPRRDMRPQSLRRCLGDIAKNKNLKVLKSDQSPRYPKYVKEVMPKIVHKTYKGRRGCVVGQGELKRGGFDPLFSLNHTCASIRYNLKRLARKTWCTTKCTKRLQMMLELFRFFFNQRLAGEKRPALYGS